MLRFMGLQSQTRLSDRNELNCTVFSKIYIFIYTCVEIHIDCILVYLGIKNIDNIMQHG